MSSQIAVVLILPLFGFGQESRPKLLLWQDGTSHSDSFYIDGYQIRSIEHGGTTISTFLLRHHWEAFSDSWHVRIMLRNNTDKRLELDPATIRLIDTEKSQYVRQESPAELVDKYADASIIQLELEINRSTLESNKRRAQTPCPPLIGAPGVIAAAQRYCEDQRRPNRILYPNTSESDLHTAQNLAAWIQETSLKRTTLFPGETIERSVWYRHNGTSLLLQVPVFDRVFEFPFPAQE